MIKVKTEKVKSLGACKTEILKLQKKEFSHHFVTCTKDQRRAKGSSEEEEKKLKENIKETKAAMAKEEVHPIVVNIVEYL